MGTLPRLTPEALREDLLAMADDAAEMLQLARDTFRRPSTQAHQRMTVLAGDLHKREKHVTAHVAAQLREQPWSLGSAQHLAFLAASLERVGDCIETLGRCGETLHREALNCSEQALTEISDLFSRTARLLQGIGGSLRSGNRSALAAARQAGAEFQSLSEAIGLRHQERVLQGICLPRVSSTFLAMLDAFREIERYTRRMSEDLEKGLAG